MQKDSLQREKIKRLIISLVIFLVIGALIISGYCLNERRKQQLAIEQTIEEFEEYKENIIGEDIKTVENYIKKISADKDNEDASAMDYYNYHDGYYRGPEDIREECAAHSNPAWLEKYICNQKSNSHEYLKNEIKNREIDACNGLDSGEIKEALDLFDKHPNWQPSHVCLAIQNYVEEGMNQEIVETSWGKPDKIKDLGTYELWWYWHGASLCEKSVIQGGEDNLNMCRESMKSRDMIAFNKSGLYFFRLLDR